MLRLLLRRKARSLYNAVRSMTGWEWARNAAFLSMGFWMLWGLHAGFWRLLYYLDGVQLIGPLLIWKLTALAMVTTFSMVVISGLITSLTTLFYSYDLPFLMKAPVPIRAVFMDKSLEAAFFSSWMIGLVLAPYMVALAQARGMGWPFCLTFASLLVPFLLLAASIGMGFTLALMHLFPSPRTRDTIWVLSSLSMAFIYVLLRFSEPEKLVRPDALMVVAQYLNYLQAPTAQYLPSWWVTRALWGYAHSDWAVFRTYTLLLFGAALAAYGLLVWAAGRVYATGYSGAQEGRRMHLPIAVGLTPEGRLAAFLRAPALMAALFWKERKSFLRDVKHWSQMVLIVALMLVYLFSIQQLPLDTAELKSLASFLNLGIAGFVIASLGLRFTFPSISLEGKAFWVVRAAPLETERLMLQKFIFSVVPMTVLAGTLVLASNHLLKADRFISVLSVGTIAVMTWTLSGMGVGFGALFPRFNVSNIHQIESSAGGFVYMAACLFYVGCTVALESVPVKMHFNRLFGKANAWDFELVRYCAVSLVVLNAAAFIVPWVLGRKTLEAYEAD